MLGRLKSIAAIETARGLTYVARDCFESLQLLHHHSETSLSIGILAGHCAEAALKAHLSCFGWSEGQLKALGHDLEKAWESARAAGLGISARRPKWLIGIGFSHAGLRYRYPNSHTEPWLPIPMEYMEDLQEILEPLLQKFVYEGGEYVEDF